MAKKKGLKLDLGMILCGAAALLGLVAICMLFAPNLTKTVTILGKSNTVEYSGLETVFGKEHVYDSSWGEMESQPFNFSFLSLLPYLLALVGVVFAVLAALGKLGKIAPIVAAACFVVAAVFFFIAIPTCVLNVSDKLSKDDISKLKEAYELGAGVIVAGVFSIVAALAVVAPTVMNLISKKK